MLKFIYHGSPNSVRQDIVYRTFEAHLLKIELKIPVSSLTVLEYKLQKTTFYLMIKVYVFSARNFSLYFTITSLN